MKLERPTAGMLPISSAIFKDCGRLAGLAYHFAVSGFKFALTSRSPFNQGLVVLPRLLSWISIPMTD